MRIKAPTLTQKIILRTRIKGVVEEEAEGTEDVVAGIREVATMIIRIKPSKRLDNDITLSTFLIQKILKIMGTGFWGFGVLGFCQDYYNIV